MKDEILKVMKWKYVCLVVLMAYFFFVFYMAVLNRDIVDLKDPVRSDLFKNLLNPGPEGYRDLILNIVCFIPVGLLVGLLFEKYRWVKALLVGLLVSLTIELSQLIWHRGVFDVNDLFNNALGALIGGIIAVAVINGTQRLKDTKDKGNRR